MKISTKGPNNSDINVQSTVHMQNAKTSNFLNVDAKKM